MEAAVHLHLREQQVRHGDVGGAGVGQHRLLQERRLHPRNQSETPKYTQHSFLFDALATVVGYDTRLGGLGRRLQCVLAVRCSRPVWTQIRTGGGPKVRPGSCRCEHSCSCLMLMYDTAHKPKCCLTRAAGLTLACLVTPFCPRLVRQVDGMDVLCVREATKFAADHCRSGKVSRD